MFGNKMPGKIHRKMPTKQKQMVRVVILDEKSRKSLNKKIVESLEVEDKRVSVSDKNVVTFGEVSMRRYNSLLLLGFAEKHQGHEVIYHGDIVVCNKCGNILHMQIFDESLIESKYVVSAGEIV